MTDAIATTNAVALTCSQCSGGAYVPTQLLGALAGCTECDHLVSAVDFDLNEGERLCWVSYGVGRCLAIAGEGN